MHAGRIRAAMIVLSLGLAVAQARAGAQADVAQLRAEIAQLRAALKASEARSADLQQRLADREARIVRMEELCRKAGVDPSGPAAPAPGAAAKLSAKEQTYLAEAKRQRADALRSLHQQRRDLGAHMARIVQGKVKKHSPGFVIDFRTGAYTFPSAEEKGRKMRQVQERVNQLNKHLAELEKNDPPFVPAIRGGFAVGKTGRFAYPVVIRQIIDKTNMLVEASVDVSPAGSDLWTVQKLRIWVSGAPTAGLVDDVEVELTGAFEITGTRPYRAPTGELKTVFVAGPFDTTRVNQVLRGSK